MKSIAFVAGMMFLAFMINSCNVCSCKKVACPAFEDSNFQNWFADYQSSQQFIFKHQSFFDTIKMGTPGKNEAYEAEQGCFGRGGQGCMMNFSVESTQITSAPNRKLAITYTGGPPTSAISLWVMGFNCSALGINDQGLVVNSLRYTGSYAASLTLNGTLFNNVQVITRDTTVDQFTEQPYKVYISKGAGIVAYEIYPGRQLWVKQ